jgi:hypothetical protein
MHFSHRIVEQGVFSSPRPVRADFAVPTHRAESRQLSGISSESIRWEGFKSVEKGVKSRISFAPYEKWEFSFSGSSHTPVSRILKFS